MLDCLDFRLTRIALERSRDSPAPEPETLNDGLTPAERISSQLDAIAAASRRTLRELGTSFIPLISIPTDSGILMY